MRRNWKRHGAGFSASAAHSGPSTAPFAVEVPSHEPGQIQGRAEQLHTELC